MISNRLFKIQERISPNAIRACRAPGGSDGLTLSFGNCAHEGEIPEWEERDQGGELRLTERSLCTPPWAYGPGGPGLGTCVQDTELKAEVGMSSAVGGKRYCFCAPSSVLSVQQTLREGLWHVGCACSPQTTILSLPPH